MAWNANYSAEIGRIVDKLMMQKISSSSLTDSFPK